MVQPVNLQLAHFNIEHTAQISKDAIAAAQQTAQRQEVTEESALRMQQVQAGLAAAEPQKVKRKGDEERDRREGERSFAGNRDTESESEQNDGKKQAGPKSFDLYA